MKSPRVYLINWPVFYDREKKCMVRREMNVAESFGELKIIFPGTDRPPSSEKALPILAREMSLFSPLDYLVLVGDWELVTWAAVLAAKATKGKIKLLKWNSRAMNYEPITAPAGLWEDDQQPVNV
jgi:hypothetical protein